MAVKKNKKKVLVDTGMKYGDKGSLVKAKPGHKIKVSISNEEWQKKYKDYNLDR